MSSAQNRKPLEFAFARAYRLYPAFFICLAFTLSVTYIISGRHYSFVAILANATILNDYFGIANIDGVYWTLQAELKFYGCIFLLLLLGIFRYWRYWLSIWTLLAIAHFFWKQPFFLEWFINPAYSFNFIGGVSAYLLYQDFKDKQALLIFVVSIFFGCWTALIQANNFNAEITVMDQIAIGFLRASYIPLFPYTQREFIV